MDKLSTTKMSSRGQVVIPEEIRKRLGLNPGVQFVVVGKNDVIILKALKQPSMDEFDSLMERGESLITQYVGMPVQIDPHIKYKRVSVGVVEKISMPSHYV